jgi:hypothetical protein
MYGRWRRPTNQTYENNKNSVLAGLSLSVGDSDDVPVADSIDSPEAFVAFELPIMQDCSDCSGVKKIYVDGVPAVYDEVSFDDHGGFLQVYGRYNHKLFSITVGYADALEEAHTVMQQILSTVHFSSTSPQTSEPFATINPSFTVNEGGDLVISGTTNVALRYMSTDETHDPALVEQLSISILDGHKNEVWANDIGSSKGTWSESIGKLPPGTYTVLIYRDFRASSY